MEKNRQKKLGVVICNKKQHEGTLYVTVERENLNKSFNIKITRKTYYVVSCEKNSNYPVGSTVLIQNLPRRISKRKSTEVVKIIKEVN